ncbi:MAG: cupredoxin domain-containing protein [Solirubrobacterales bacterium]
MLHKSLIALAVAIPLSVSACGGGGDTSSSTSAATTTESSSTSTAAAGGGGAASSSVDISETEYKLDPSDATAKAGTVTFNVSNDGGVTHALEIEGNDVEEETDDISAGQSAKLSVDLKPGTYEIYCPIDNHRDLGMEGSLTVQ